MAQVTLSIAGSDCCSGAGIQADLKTFSSLGVHGLTALTSVLAETPHSVESIFPLPVETLQSQISCLTPVYPIGAIKTGMLYSAEMVRAVADCINNSSLSVAHLVVDPVLAASTGDSLAQENIVKAYKEVLLPIATIVTPNIPEAEVLLGRSLETVQDFKDAALEISKTYNIACLLKGGHAAGATCCDILAIGEETRSFSAERLDIPMSHGTGCTLSAAIAANLAKGQILRTAVRNAKDWLHQALKTSLHWRVEGQETYCINQAEL